MEVRMLLAAVRSALEAEQLLFDGEWEAAQAVSASMKAKGLGAFLDLSAWETLLEQTESVFQRATTLLKCGFQSQTDVKESSDVITEARDLVSAFPIDDVRVVREVKSLVSQLTEAAISSGQRIVSGMCEELKFKECDTFVSELNQTIGDAIRDDKIERDAKHLSRVISYLEGQDRSDEAYVEALIDKLPEGTKREELREEFEEHRKQRNRWNQLAGIILFAFVALIVIIVILFRNRS